RNVCDGLVRHRPGDGDGDGWSTVTVAMGAAAYRFGAGHRLRLQISGGAHPRFTRNTGTGEPPATATRLVPVDIEISHETGSPAALSLPVVTVAGRHPAPAARG
ncbi:MAG TPA: CocE/NonD family hydrolase C-terminal non-catalytic domain-containing protein, partial [Streptosporangiaceae bacterium]|nr:CocE/NonD family hydrolase C-terminal non-catalytic domain-containing protein [Streptosporangiaceae bacterium]